MIKRKSDIWLMVSAFAYPMRANWMLDCIYQVGLLPEASKRSPVQRLFALAMRKKFNLLSERYAGSIPYNMQIGEGAVFPHQFNGVHIAKESVIGRNCWIMQHVTIGVNIIQKTGYAPVIGDNVFLAAGATVIGRCTIGDGAKIGANVTLVNAEVPAGAVIINKSAYDLTNSRYVRDKVTSAT